MNLLSYIKKKEKLQKHLDTPKVDKEKVASKLNQRIDT